VRQTKKGRKASVLKKKTKKKKSHLKEGEGAQASIWKGEGRCLIGNFNFVIIQKRKRKKNSRSIVEVRGGGDQRRKGEDKFNTYFNREGWFLILFKKSEEGGF